MYINKQARFNEIRMRSNQVSMIDNEKDFGKLSDITFLLILELEYLEEISKKLDKYDKEK